MKTKILKKIIAVLCAATMSASAMPHVGAIYYQNSNELSNNEMSFISNLNNTIFNMGENIKKMKQIVNGLKCISNSDKQNMFYQLDSIYSSLSNMHNEKLICPSRTIIVNFNTSILPIKAHIGQTLNLLKSGKIRVNDFNNSIYNIDKQLKILYQNTIGAIQQYNTNNNIKETNDNQAKNSLNSTNISKNNNMLFSMKDAIIINNLKNNILNMRNKMSIKNNDPHATDLQIKLTNKWQEVNRKVEEAFRFANHRNLDDQPVQNICAEFMKECINSGCLLGRDNATIQKGINLMDDTIQKLNKFTLNNDLTVVTPNQKSGLKREAENKLWEMCRLIDCAKRSYDAKFSGNQLTDQAFKFYRGIDLSNPNSNEVSDQLKQAITYLDAAIASIRRFDDGKKSKTTIWKEEASKNIDRLLNQATEEMKRSSNQTTIAGIKQEFQPLVCGEQHLGNCWLYAIRNAMNFGAHIKGQHNNIVKNTGVLDENGFDSVERFFAQSQSGLSIDEIKRGGITSKQSAVLSKLGINHSSVFLELDKDNVKANETNQKIIKTLLLKHFANSITPVLVSVRYDEKSINSHNGVGSSHGLAIVGLDISQNSVVVADSNHQDLQVYSLDRIASVICNAGFKDQTQKNTGMVFPSFTNTNNFNYNNLNHSWAEFESQLLPAISKAY